MRKKVIRSLFFGALCVMLASFIILTPVFLYTFQFSATREAYTEMQNSINHIKPIAQMSLSFRTSKMDRLFNESMNQLAYFSKTNILFMDTKGNVIWANKITDIQKVKTEAKKALSLLDSASPVKSKGLLDSVYGESTVTVGEYLENESGQRSWAVFCSKSAPDFSDHYMIVLLDILIIELATLMFAAVFMFFFSRSITVPLKKINNTLKCFAAGDFTRRVEYKTDNEIGELADNINRMADTIENLEKMRSDFVSDISHELRTPMTSISGFIEGILDGTIPRKEEDKYLAIALSESKRLSKLTNELLTLTRIDQQVKSLEITDFDIDELSRIVLLKFEDAIMSKEINVDFVFDGDEFIVSADKDRIIQVLTNLFHNSVKFTPYGGTITILLKKSSRKCSVSIRNTGQGIDADKLRFIWERFYKADDSRSNDKTGVGIGLYVVKKIIDAHGEKISVLSEPGKHTEFTFTLPLA